MYPSFPKVCGKGFLCQKIKSSDCFSITAPQRFKLVRKAKLQPYQNWLWALQWYRLQTCIWDQSLSNGRLNFRVIIVIFAKTSFKCQNSAAYCQSQDISYSMFFEATYLICMVLTDELWCDQLEKLSFFCHYEIAKTTFKSMLTVFY